MTRKAPIKCIQPYVACFLRSVFGSQTISLYSAPHRLLTAHRSPAPPHHALPIPIPMRHRFNPHSAAFQTDEMDDNALAAMNELQGDYMNGQNRVSPPDQRRINEVQALVKDKFTRQGGLGGSHKPHQVKKRGCDNTLLLDFPPRPPFICEPKPRSENRTGCIPPYMLPPYTRTP